MTTAQANAAALDSLNTSIAQITARIAEVTASTQPDYSIDGEQVSAGTYLTQLQQTLDGLLAQRQRLAPPFLVRSRGRGA